MVQDFPTLLHLATAEDKKVASPGTARSSLKRIEIIDVLRGFSLLGILLVHSAHVFLYQQGGDGAYVLNAREVLMMRGVDLFITDKFFSIFSLLFGLNFAIQLQQAKVKGVPFIKRFMWRLTLLLGIGLLHLVVFRFEILHIYALVGIVLVLLHACSNRNLLLASIVLFAANLASCFYKKAVIGSFVAVFGARLGDILARQLFNFHVLTIASLFVFGLYLGRKNVFSDSPKNTALFNRLILITVVLLISVQVSSYLLGGNSIVENGVDRPFYSSVAFILKNLFISTLYVGILTQLHRHKAFQRTLNLLTPVGKMGLSIYVMQSFFLLLLHYFYVRYAELAAIKLDWVIEITVLFFAVQVIIARHWMERFHMGPLEWLWRSLIYLKRQPIRKPQQLTDPMPEHKTAMAGA